MEAERKRARNTVSRLNNLEVSEVVSCACLFEALQ